MDDTWHDILSSSSSEVSETFVEKEALANDILGMHIHCYHLLNSQNDLKWYYDVYDNDDTLICLILITYCFLLQKLKAKCI
jgi:hypothetical protein